MIDDILFEEGEEQEMILEIPIGVTLNAPLDILVTSQLFLDIPEEITEYISVFV